MEELRGIIDVDRLRALAAIGQDGASELVEELAVLFRDNRDAYLDAVRTALAEEDPEAIRVSVHAFKASSRSLGAVQVVAICEAIEDAARAGDLGRARANFDGLAPAITEALEALFSLAASGSLDE